MLRRLVKAENGSLPSRTGGWGDPGLDKMFPLKGAGGFDVGREGKPSWTQVRTAIGMLEDFKRFTTLLAWFPFRRPFSEGNFEHVTPLDPVQLPYSASGLLACICFGALQTQCSSGFSKWDSGPLFGWRPYEKPKDSMPILGGFDASLTRNPREPTCLVSSWVWGGGMAGTQPHNWGRAQIFHNSILDFPSPWS